MFSEKFPLFEDKYWREISLHEVRTPEKKYSNFSNETRTADELNLFRPRPPTIIRAAFVEFLEKQPLECRTPGGQRLHVLIHSGDRLFWRGSRVQDAWFVPQNLAILRERERPLFRLERYYGDRCPFKKPDRLIILNILSPYSLSERKEKLRLLITNRTWCN